MESTIDARPSRGLNIGLWIAQALLALAFLAAGGMKLAMPPPPGMTLSVGLMHFIGVSEVLGGLGMILPAATRIAPKLTGAAGVGLLTIMVLAAGYHVQHGELSHLPPVFVLGALAAFVAWGRLKHAPLDQATA